MTPDTDLRTTIVAHLSMAQVGPDDWRLRAGEITPCCEHPVSKSDSTPGFKVSDEYGVRCFYCAKTYSMRWLAKKLGLQASDPQKPANSASKPTTNTARKSGPDPEWIYSRSTCTPTDLDLIARYFAGRGVPLTPDHLTALQRAGLRINRYTPRDSTEQRTEIVYPIHEHDPDTGTAGDIVRKLGRIRIDPTTAAKIDKKQLGSIPRDTPAAFVLDPHGPHVPPADKRAVILEGLEDAVTIWANTTTTYPRIYLVASSWEGLPRCHAFARHCHMATMICDPDEPKGKNPLPSLRGALALREHIPSLQIRIPRLGHGIDANKAQQAGRYAEWLDSWSEPTIEEIDLARSWGRDSAAAGPQGAQPPAYSEDAMAQALVDQHGTDLRYVSEWSRWMIWDSTRWARDSTLKVWNIARVVARDHAAELATWLEAQGKEPTAAKAIATSKVIVSLERIARSDPRVSMPVDVWDADPMALNTPRGIVDLAAGTMRPNHKDALCSRVTGTAPPEAPSADCPLWKKFLGEVFNGDTELIAFLQRALGYAISGDTREHCLFFLYGTGRNGKGVLMRTVSRILGDYARTLPMEALTESKVDRHPTDIAGMRGARLVMATETEEGRRWAESKLKSLTGGDRLTARFMRGDYFEFDPVFKLFIQGNHKPRLRNLDTAIRARIKLIPFNVSFQGREDQQLETKLEAEWPAILAWMIEGCIAWQEDGLRDPQAVQDATEEYFAGEDAIGRWIDECCDVKAFVQARSTDLWRSWHAWATENNEYQGTQRKLLDSLEARGYERVRTERMRGFRGIAPRGGSGPPAPGEH